MAKKIKFVESWLLPLATFSLLFSTMVALFLPKSQFQKTKEGLVVDPQNPSLLLEAAATLIDQGDFAQAQNLLELVQKIEPHQTQLETLWQKKHYQDPDDISQLISAWEKIAQEKKDCRDCFFQLAFLHAKLWQDQEAEENLAQVFALDPNFEPARTLAKILGN